MCRVDASNVLKLGKQFSPNPYGIDQPVQLLRIAWKYGDSLLNSVVREFRGGILSSRTPPPPSPLRWRQNFYERGAGDEAGSFVKGPLASRMQIGGPFADELDVKPPSLAGLERPVSDQYPSDEIARLRERAHVVRRTPIGLPRPIRQKFDVRADSHRGRIRISGP